MIYQGHYFTPVLMYTDACVCVCLAQGRFGEVWMAADRQTFLGGQRIMDAGHPRIVFATCFCLNQSVSD